LEPCTHIRLDRLTVKAKVKVKVKGASMLRHVSETEYVFRSRDGSTWIHLADGTERLATVRETIDYPTDDPDQKPPD
jgi:hypothetical protein